MSKIELPVDVAKKFELVQQPPAETLYFGKEIGNITFSQITESQCIKLIKMNSPYIKLIAAKVESTDTMTAPVPVETTEAVVEKPTTKKPEKV